MALQAPLLVQSVVDRARYSCAQEWLCKIVSVFPGFMFPASWLLPTGPLGFMTAKTEEVQILVATSSCSLVQVEVDLEGFAKYNLFFLLK